MFHVELAPLGGIFRPLKSDLGVFWAKIPLYPYNVKHKKRIFSKPFHGQIFIFWNPFIYIFMCTKIRKITIVHFFSFDACSRPMWPWLQLPPFFAQCPNWGTQVPILKDLFQTYSSCNKNTKTTTLLLQHIGSLLQLISYISSYRNFALDFLDSVRTKAPCGMPKG